MGALLTIDEAPIQPTGHICSDCGEHIGYTEEVWLIQVVQLQRHAGTTHAHQIINEQDPDGDFLFDPYLFCFSCWEKLYDELKENFADEPPVLDDESMFECTCCGSGVREWEYTGIFTLGEFGLSKRAPNNVRGPSFDPSGEPELICLACLSMLNSDQIEMWDDISQLGECSGCTQERCWRTGICDCGCHQEHTEEHTEE